MSSSPTSSSVPSSMNLLSMVPSAEPTNLVSNAPSIAPSRVPSPMLLSSSFPSSSPSPSFYSEPSTPTSGESVIGTIGEVWYLFLIIIIAVGLFIFIREYYKRSERNDPNSAYSRRQRRREREEALREYRRAILRNAERRRRDWDAIWDEEGGMMRREMKKEYILSKLCIKVS